MAYKKKLKLLTFSILLANMPHSAKADPAKQIEYLKQQVLFAESNNRYDIAESAIEHWLSIDANNMEVLYLRAEILILKGDNENAKKNIELIESKASTYTKLNLLKSLYEAFGHEKLKLQQARFLAGNKRGDEAIKLYQELFPYGMPTIAIDIEYLTVLSYSSSVNYAKTKQILNDRIKDYPFIKEYRLALANLLADGDAKEIKESLVQFDILSKSEPYSLTILNSWETAITKTPIEYLTKDEIYKIESAYPFEIKIKDKVKELRKNLNSYNKKINEPGYKALLEAIALIDKSDYSAAEDKYLIAKRYHPKNPKVYLGLGNIKFNQAKYTEALNYFIDGKKLQSNDNKIDWNILIDKANFWIEIGRIEKLSESNQSLSIELFNKLLSQNPSEIYCYLAIAKIHFKSKNFILADEFYNKALDLNPNSYEALVGKLKLLFEDNKPAEAFLLSDKLTQTQKDIIANYISDKRLEFLIADAQTLITQHNLNKGSELINIAVNIKSQDPWLTFNVANLLNQINKNTEADKYISEYLIKNQNTDEINYAYAIYLSKNGRLIAALEEINKIKPESRTINMIETQQRLSINYQFDHFESLLKQDRVKAINYLSIIEDNANNESGLLIKIASTLYDLDVQDHARKIINKIKYSNKWPFYSQLEYIRLLIKLVDFNKLEKVDKTIDLKHASLEEIEKYNQLIFEYKCLKANELVAQGKFSQAKNLYLNILQNDALFSSVFIESNFFEVNKTNDKNQIEKLMIKWIDQHFDQLVNIQKYSDYPRVKRIQILVDLEQNKQAENALLVLLEDTKAAERELYSASQSALSLKKWDLAEKLSYAALLAQSEKKPIETSPAISNNLINLTDVDKKWLYQNSNNDWLANNIKANIQDLRDKSDGYITFFPEYRFGTNTNSIGSSIEAKIPVNKIGYAIFRINPLSLDTTSQNLNAADFGTSQLHLRGHDNSNLQTTGVGYNLGWMGKNWVADIGRTPENFLVSDVIGGLRLDGDINSFSWAINASRRPVKNTVLSYAGLSDPYTKQVWGGARQNGVGLSLGYDNGSPVGIWSNWQYQYINGQNLKDNEKLQGQVGLYGEIWKDPSNLTNLDWGLNTIFMHYDNNQNEFSYGNGGYFSPQAYASISLPITTYGKFDNWSYSFRVFGAYSYSKVNDSNYYPSDAQLQQQAFMSGESTIFSGSTTNALTYGITAIVEKRITDHWSIGGRAQIQRALFYNPSNVGLYLKYDFNDHWDAVNLLPKVPNTIVDYAEY